MDALYLAHPLPHLLQQRPRDRARGAVAPAGSDGLAVLGKIPAIHVTAQMCQCARGMCPRGPGTLTPHEQ